LGKSRPGVSLDERARRGAISFRFAIVLVGFALANTVGQYRRHVPAAERPMPARSILGGCLRALSGVKDEVDRGGWTPERSPVR
jgi:hypothetical protein